MKTWLIAIEEYRFLFKSMSSTYKIKKGDGTPTSFYVHIRFFFASDEVKLFDFFVKSKIPTP